MLWYKSVRLIAESHKNDANDKDGYEKAIRVFTRGITLVRDETKRENKSDKLAYIEAMLTYECAEVMRDGVLTGRLSDQDTLIRRRMMTKRSFRFNSMHPMLFKKLSEVCNVKRKHFKICQNCLAFRFIFHFCLIDVSIIH